MRKVPVLILAFNRPEHVLRAMEVVHVYQPNSLYLACDGPRDKKDGEVELVLATRKAMLDVVDWECEVKTLFREKNLGCAQAVYEAITWFFDQEEYGVICEDDIVFSLDFFKLCEDLLPRYADNEQIMCINSMNPSMRTDISNSYVYRYRSSCWGWASWRRAWARMDMSMTSVPKLKCSFLIKKLGLFEGIMTMRYFKDGYKQLPYYNSWAYRWYLSVLVNNGLVIIPGVNLSKNIGTNGGVHFESRDIDPYFDLPLGNVKWPLHYNDSFIIDKKQSHYDAMDFFRLRKIGFKRIVKTFFNSCFNTLLFVI